jgi:hypothetical protein
MMVGCGRIGGVYVEVNEELLVDSDSDLDANNCDDSDSKS